jgi:hypothetical protein
VPLWTLRQDERVTAGFPDLVRTQSVNPAILWRIRVMEPDAKPHSSTMRQIAPYG